MSQESIEQDIATLKQQIGDLKNNPTKNDIEIKNLEEKLRELEKELERVKKLKERQLRNSRSRNGGR